MPKIEVFDKNLQEYEDWFVSNRFVYQSELKALEKAIPKNKNGFEIGIGSGLFAKPLGIKEGIEPSSKMREKAIKRGLRVFDAVAENLPYPNESKDFALMVTTICFVDDIYLSLQEVNRILKTNGYLIIGFVDQNSPIGKIYLEYKNESLFYRDAIFFGTEEVHNLLRKTGFKIEETYQTVFGKLEEVKQIQKTLKGYGKDSFIVIKAKKSK